MGYARSPFGFFERYLRFVVGLHEEDIQLVIKRYNWNFVTYESAPGIYSLKDTSEVVYTKIDQKGTPKTEYDDISIKQNFLLTRFGSTFGTLGCDEKTFLITFSVYKLVMKL